MIYRITGTVTSSNRSYFSRPDFSRYVLRVYNVGFSSEEEIVGNPVNSDGSFNFEVVTDASAIRLKLFLGTAKADESAIYPKSEPMINVIFTADESQLGDPVFSTVTSRLDDQGVASIGALSDEDLIKLSSLTSVDNATLSRLRTSHQVFAAVDAAPGSEYEQTDAAYTAFRTNSEISKQLTFVLSQGKGSTANLSDVFGYSRSQLSDILQTAADNKEIPEGLNSADTLNMLEGVRNGMMLNLDDDNNYLDAKLIHMTDGAYEDKAALLDAMLDAGGMDAVIPANPSGHTGIIGDFIQLKTLSGHLQNFLPFAQNVVNTTGITFDYYQATLDGPQGWAAYGSGHPAGYSNDEEYHADIFKSIAEGQPSARVARGLNLSGITDKASIYTAITNNRDFDIKEQGTNDFFEVKESPNPSNPREVTRAMLDKIQAVQRAVKLTGENDSLDAATALIVTGMDSSYGIAQKGRVGFVKLMNEHSVDTGTAEVIYNRARGIFEMLTMWAVQHKQYDSPDAGLPAAAKGGASSYTPGGSVENNLPDMEGLFGSLNTCNCSACQSVYSPAAYLTDMLNWLNKDVGTDFNYTSHSVAYQCLMMSADNLYPRRLDIQTLLLCCDNTNTLIPYIDIINELLSASVLNSSGSMTNYNLMQTTKSSEEVLVEPEHRLQGAEDQLDQIYYPWTLPYNPAHYESLTYLKELNSPYHELIKAFSKNAEQYKQYGTYSTTNTITSTSTYKLPWAEAYLELNHEEKQLIDGAKDGVTTFWDKFWGFSLTGANTPKVSPVMKVAGTELDELEDVLTASFIEPGGAIAVVPDTDDVCDFDKYSFNPALSKERADRFMRFLRLKRKAGVSTLELDLALKNLSTGGNTLNALFIEKFASALAFCRKYSVSFLSHQVWFSSLAYTEIWSTNNSEYYKNKFLNPLLSAGVTDFFDASKSNNIFTISTLTTEHKQKLSSVLKISIPHIDFLVTHLGITSITMTKAWLAKLESYAGLINIFNLDAKEIGNVFRLIGDPLNTTTFPDTLKAVWDFETNLKKLTNLAVNANDLVDIIEGKGYYNLNSTTGVADNAKFDKEAEEAWKNVEQAFQTAIKANPDRKFQTVSPWMPILTADITFFSNIIVDNFALAFNIDRVSAVQVISWYASDNSVSYWVNDFMQDPFNKQGAGYEREWTINTRNMKAPFTKLYRVFKRIRLIADICGMDASALAVAVNYGVNPSVAPIPGTPFYWVKSAFTSASANGHIFKLFWIKNVVDQASALQMYVAPANSLTQPDSFQLLYLKEIILYFQYGTPSPGVSYGATEIYNLYDKLGVNSSYKALSKQEFLEVFQRAENKKDVVDDLVDIFEKADRFIAASENLDIKFIDAWSWVWTNAAGTGVTSLSAYCPDIRRVLNARYPQFKAWSDFIVPIQNDFRIKLRDALVAYHIGKLGFAETNDLFTYYLLDPQMSPCMMISRVVAASCSVQLLVHRALLGLEPAIDMSPANKKEWQWRKNYRVWEANRKVFLYPENWIDPTLRLNKTYLFKEAEDLLQQDDINAQNTEQAFVGYLKGLAEISRLDVRAVYNEYTDPDHEPGGTFSGWSTYKPTDDLVTHVFARSWNAPYTYYHRVLAKGLWTAWEKIDVEVDSDHLIPTVFNRKLYLFFPLFIEKVYDNNKDRRYMEVRLCYIKYDSGKWSNKKIMGDKLLAGRLAYHNVENKEENLDLLTGIPSAKSNVQFSTLQYPLNVNNGNQNVHLYWIVKPDASNDGRDELHFSIVSLQKKDFYFWAQTKSDGDLIIHVRRTPRETDEFSINSGLYTDFAFESSFLIGAGDERLKIIPPVQTYTPHGNDPYLLDRPKESLPYYQQITVEKTSTARLHVRPDSNPGSTTQNMPLLENPAGKQFQTYPDQYQHFYYYTPFFYSDDRRNFFVKPAGTQYYFNMAYDFTLNEHPFIHKMMSAVNRFGVEGLLAPDPISNAGMVRQSEIQNHPYPLPGPGGILQDYSPTWIVNGLPALNYDFSAQGAYSIYNWEVFFHTVSLIGRQLRQSNKFADAFKWLSYIFDPNNRETNLPSPNRFWKVQPFFNNVNNDSIQTMMRTLAATAGSPYYNPQKRQDIVNQITAWRANPFDPHMIAGMRPRAYMLWTVMEFVENIIDWADSLFRQDTLESINEALNLYILASQLLGTRPVKASRPDPECKNFGDIMDKVDDFSNLFVEFENYAVTIPGPTWVLGGAEGTVYTGNPYNPVFDGPKGPARPHSTGSGLTVGGSGTGIGGTGFTFDGPIQVIGTTTNISVSDLYYCIPDNPKMTDMWDKVDDRLFKIRHCMNIDGKLRQLALFSAPIDPALLVQAVAAGLSIEDALSDLATPMPHYRFSYMIQKANEFNNEVKGLGSQLLSLLEKKDAEALSLFRQVHEQNILSASRALKQMAIDEARQNMATLQSSKNLIQIRLDDYQGRQFTNSRELAAQGFTKKAEELGTAEQSVRLVAGLLNLIPEVYITAPAPATLGFGGSKISNVVSAGANVLGIFSTIQRNKASMSLTFASYDRRQEDWNLQIKTATEELAQVDRQILSSEIRIAVTEKELQNHDLQVAQSAEMYDWLKSKYTNSNLYTWMTGEVKSVYKKAFNLAFDMAKRAQVCMDYELGTSGTNIIQYGQWDSSKSGLLAGERLGLQLKQLENRFIENNERELELSKNISLALLDPISLEQLKLTGKCEIELPEVLFNLDHPSHYFRRIKSVSLSIPCIAGPNTNISAKLSLTGATRRESSIASSYAAKRATSGSVLDSIATSSSQNDSGMFELNFRDERYIPFEGKGAISIWTLELTDFQQFDRESIADVIMHMKYTAKEGGELLGTAAKADVQDELAIIKQGLPSPSVGMHYAFSLRHDMPNEWHAFKQSGQTDISIMKNRLPYVMQALGVNISNIKIVVYTHVAHTLPKLNVKYGGASSVVVQLGPIATGSTYLASAFVQTMSFGNPITIREEIVSLPALPSLPKADIEDIMIIANINV